MVFYNIQIGPLFMATIIAFLIAACVLLLKMTSIFGIQDIQEKKIIRMTIVIYSVVFAVRIISLVLIVSDKQTFIKVYTEKYLEF
jgi:hypothetical protein